jgi:hypothetical protein
VQAIDHLGERAVHRRHQLVRQRVGHGEQCAAGTEVVVLGKRAVKVREVLRTTRALDLRRAGGRISVEAGVAATARIEVRVRDAVALLEGPAQRIGLHVLAQTGHLARHLVAEDPAILGQAQRRVATPEVQVRAAQVGKRDLDEDGVGLQLREVVLPDLERLARTEEHGGFPLRHGGDSSGFAVVGGIARFRVSDSRDP